MEREIEWYKGNVQGLPGALEHLPNETNNRLLQKDRVRDEDQPFFATYEIESKDANNAGPLQTD